MPLLSSNTLGTQVDIAEGCEVAQSYLAYVQISPGCRVIGCYIEGHPDAPIVIGPQSELIHCELRSFPCRDKFSFGAWKVAATPVHIGANCRLQGVRIENSTLDANVQATRCHILSSYLGTHCTVRPHSSLTLTHAAAYCSVGSEISKSILSGAGFVSEHTGSYLSLVAPSEFPILTPDGEERLLRGLPNLTNIGAGTVFANYSGKPKPSALFEQSSGSQKGTAIVYGAFTAVNSTIVNRYGQPTAQESPFDLLRRQDLTILGMACFAERKVTGRIPAFSYAGSTSASSIQLGWVLEHHPGIVLNILKKMQQRIADLGHSSEHSNDSRHPLQDLIEGTIRLELQLLCEQSDGRTPTFFSQAQIRAGIETFERQLDGRWAIDEAGKLKTSWRFEPQRQKWYPHL